jgi:hypothetical protein
MPIDYGRYPANWKSEIVPRILARAGDACEKCGLPNGERVTSVALRLSEEGKTKVRRFWLRDESDLTRMEPFIVRGSAKRVRVILTVAHLDHDEENAGVADERLRAWCQHCHLTYDAEEKRRRMSGHREPRP